MSAQLKLRWSALERHAARYKPGYREALHEAGSLAGDVFLIAPEVYAAIQEAHRPPPPPAAEKQWPRWAKALARLKTSADKGVGDTAARVLGLAGESFKAWHERIFGEPCDCQLRQSQWNARFPYETRG